VLSLRQLSRPLRGLARRMRDYECVDTGTADLGGNEVALLEHAFAQMTQRIETQAAHERNQASAHRETMAGLAHDLRTPLTALHGLLEAMGQGDEGAAKALPPHLLRAALSQSDKVRRLSQQLFELAALQSATEVPQRERFRIDELVADAVGKFRLMAGDTTAPEVELAAESPGALEVDGDLQLVERALGNLIDNARRHGRGPGPVMVSLAAQGGDVLVVVQDRGPGLPAELSRRLQGGLSPREPLLRRGAGGIGGLGLAIAQRVAQLHGGSLRPLPAPQGGTRLCLTLPRAQ
jgi:signal transduction histidine kinase